MNKLTKEKQRQVVAALVEDNSIRATCRMTGTAKGTAPKLLVDLGKACAEYQDKTLRNLTCSKIQCDEIWLLFMLKRGTFQRGKKDNLDTEMSEPLRRLMQSLNLSPPGILGTVIYPMQQSL